MLLEIGIGDAYGAGFEFCNRTKIDQFNTVEKYIPHGLGIEPGLYTDDTQMSLAVAEVLIACDLPTSDDFAEAFVRRYKRDPRKGYARGFQELLAQCEDGIELRNRIRPGSRRNGAVMRSVPLGLIPDVEALLQVARAQAVVTHNTYEGILSSQIAALMAHYCLYEGVRLNDLPALISRKTGFDLVDDWNSEVECDAIQTIHAVNTALLRNRNLPDLARDCVNFGGDVDSVAAIALGIASLSNEYDKEIPSPLWEGLENGEFGRDFLIRMDAELATRFSLKL